MNLQVAPTYQPDANEVSVDFRSTLDDLTTVTVADNVTATLYSQTMDAVGTPSLHQLAQLFITSAYIQPEQNYFFRFRNPQRSVNLVILISAVYGANTFTKQVAVGEGVSSHFDMQLPDNLTWDINPLTISPVQGTLDQPLTPVAVVLAPEIQQYITKYDFTIGAPLPDFDPLTYSGGGNRLLLSNRTNAYFLQLANNTSSWSLSAYLFMEPGITNLLPNPFFLNVTGSSPTGYDVDVGSALLTQTVTSDAILATGAQLWTIRVRQGNKFTPFNHATVSVHDPVPVTAGVTYCFSAYVQVVNQTNFAVPKNLTFIIQWLNGSTPISTTQQDQLISGFQALSLGFLNGVAPVGATNALLSWKLSPLDPGADVSLSLFSPQLEAGSFPTSRTNGVRQTDVMNIPEYNAANQKIRMAFIPGFASGQDNLDRVILAGPIIVTLTATQNLVVNVPAVATVAATPLVFAAGDLVDFAVEHLAGEMVKLYLNGILAISVPLPTFSASPATLIANGTGMEITTLTVFSRA